MKLLREPLLHFLLLGAAIFAAYGLLSRQTADRPGQIVITQGKIENMMTTFARTWQRPPTEKELNGLIQDYLREEVAYREAKALGLDQDDTVIRRRLRQKLEFVSEDIAGLVKPTDADLEAYLKQHAQEFQAEPVLSFTHVYLNPQDHGENLDREVQQILTGLEEAGEKADPAAFGDPFLLDHEFTNVAVSEIKRLFGEKFATGVSAIKPGEWHGPVASGYGSHLVLVRERTEGRVPALAEVREEVLREWTNAKRVETMEKFYQSLLERYSVTIETAKEIKTAEMR